jgi:hypothetical protein
MFAPIAMVGFVSNMDGRIVVRIVRIDSRAFRPSFKIPARANTLALEIVDSKSSILR